MANTETQNAPPSPIVESGFISERYQRGVKVQGFADLAKPKIIFLGAARSFRPVGGVKIIMQQVAMLRAAGFNAYMLCDSGFPIWIDDDFVRFHARVLVSNRFAVSAEDALVLPESTSDQILSNTRDWPGRKILSAMNIVGLRPHSGRTISWDDVGAQGKIALSEFLQSAMKDEFGWSDVALIPPTISEDVFYPSNATKDKTILVSGRKNPATHANLRHLFQSDTETFGDFKWIDLENRSEFFVAEHLRRATLSVCIGGVEGFGVPPVEAMACGAIPCGYPGAHGPDEFITKDNGFWSETAKAEDIFETMKQAIKVKPKSQRHKKLLAAGKSTAARYKSAVAAEKLLEFWSEHAPKARIF